MPNVINTGFNSGLIKYTFTDSDGEMVASFRLNPTDVRLVRRCEEASKKISDIKKALPKEPGIDEVIAVDEEIEKVFSYVLGYNAGESLFGLISATTVLADGDIFANKVLDRIADTVGAEISKRKQKMMNKAKKYTGKYRS